MVLVCASDAASATLPVQPDLILLDVDTICSAMCSSRPMHGIKYSCNQGEAPPCCHAEA